MHNASSAGPRRRLARRRAALTAIAGVSLLAFAVPAVAGATTRTWNGGGQATPVGSGWSNSSNWSGGNAPGNGDSVFFPNLAGCNPGANTCYTSHNDLASLSLAQFTLSAAGAYAISGNAITLGTGGLNVAPDVASSTPGSNSVNIPFTLGANQTWSIDGNGNGSQLTLAAPVTGTSHTLTVTLQNTAGLALLADMDAGLLTVNGGSASNSGPTAAANGTLILAGSSGTMRSLNPGGSAVSLNNINLDSFNGAIGGTLSTTGDFFQIGSGNGNTQTLTINSGTSATFDSGSTIRMFIQKPAGATPVAGTENSQLVANSDVNLNNVNLQLVRSDFASCGQLVPVGTVYTLVQVAGPGTLTGTFNGLADNSTLAVGGCTAQTAVRINYNRTSNPRTVTATVVGSPVSTMTALQVANSTPTAGQSDTFNVSVTPIASGAPEPTGSVVVQDTSTTPATTLCTAPLTAGASSSTGSCSGSFGTAGTHNVVASYNGDANNGSSASSPQAVNVQAATTTTTTNTNTNTTTTTTTVLPVGPSLAQIFAALQSALAAFGVQLHSFTPATLGNHKVLYYSAALLEGGKVTITLYIYVTPQGVAARSAKTKKITLASGSATLKTAGRVKIKLNLSAKGRKALKRSKKARIGLVTTFTPTNGVGKQTASSSITLRAKKKK